MTESCSDSQQRQAMLQPMDFQDHAGGPVAETLIVLAKLKAAVLVPPSILKLLPNVTEELPRVFNYSAIYYNNAKLFPFTSLEHTDPELNNKKWKVVSPVFSFSVGALIENLTDPVTLVFQVQNASQRLKVGYWDFEDKDGFGDWRTDGCEMVSISGNFCTAHCYHLTNFAILQDLSPFKEIQTVIMEPVTYVGSCICLLCLMAVLLTYISCFRFLNVPKKMKHSVINICITVCLLIVTFTMGINRTDHHLPCCIVGMLIHYLTLCAIFWITITSKNMLKKFMKAEKPPAPPPEPIMMPLPPKPMIRFYLLGWGVPLIVCGITAAVNLNHYAEEEYCFLEWEPSIGAFFGPVALLIVLNLILFMRISCVVRGATSHLSETEPEEVHTNEIELAPKNNSRGRCIDTRSVTSDDSDTSSNSSIMDLERRPITQLRALVAILFLYILMWLCAAMAVAKPLREVIPMQGVIFSYFYGAFSIFFGGFMLGYYCLSRKDSRESWKRFFTCQKIPTGASQMTHLNGHVIQSDSNNEVETISGKNYNIAKAVQLKNLPQKDTNLVTAQNNSSITEGSVSSSHDQMPSFYNPRQNGVAKKFWEKKHHSKILNKDFCKEFGGSGNDSNTDISSVSKLQKHLSQSSTGDNNTHFNVQIQIQGNNAKSQNAVMFNHNLPSYENLFPPSNAGSSSLYSGTALIDRNLIPPPVGGSQTPTEVTASPSCSIVSSQPSSQLPHLNHCRSPSSSSLGTRSYPSAFMPIQPRNNTLPRQGKEVNTKGIEQVQTNGSVPRPRDFDGQSQTSDQNNHGRRSSPARARMKSPSPSKISYRHGNNLYNHGNNLYRSRTPNESKTFSGNEMSDCSVSKEYFRGRAPSVGYSSDGSRHPRSLKSFVRDVEHRIPEGDASVLSDNPSLSGSNKRVLPDSDSQIHRNRNKVKHDSDGHISEPIHRRHHHHHHRSHGSHRHSRSKMSKQRSLNWEDFYKERPPKVPYTYVNHNYAEKVFENLLKVAKHDNINPKSKVFWLPRSTSSFEKVFHDELKPMVENVDSTTTEDDDEDLTDDVWVLKKPAEDLKKETSV